MTVKKEKEEVLKIPKELPVLPVRDIVVFPYMIIPLFVARALSINAIDEALGKDRMIFLATQKDQTVEEPTPDQLYGVGTVALIMRMLKMPDGRIKILVQGVARARVEKVLQEEPFLKVQVRRMREHEPAKGDLEAEALVRSVKEQMQKVATMGKVVLPDIMLVAENLDDPGRLSDLLGSNLGLRVHDAQAILEVGDPLARLRRVNELLTKEISLLEMQEKITSRAKGEIDKSQREYYLREQLKAIQKELGETDERSGEMAELRQKITDAGMPEAVQTQAVKQLDRLGHMHQEAAEASMLRTYLDWLVELPWSRSTTDNLDIPAAERVLDEDHYDLEKVKTRILEYLAVRKLREQMKGPILCFVGPPGVGKTSLGRSIARALGRKFARISLGGVRDEAEIRGHRRTYVGALPGKIIQGINTAGSNNPVFMLDEIDKLGADFRGDPSAALLEVLDPEQNNTFADHYLGLPFDLSKVLFIATANMMDPIPGPLKDRMEVLVIPGYTDDEKLHIARTYILPRQLREHGLAADAVRLPDRVILKIISQYTREAGLRNLEREIAAVCRKLARKVASGETGPYALTPKMLEQMLGPQRFHHEGEQENSECGVATGLAWTPVGGEILYVETTLMKGGKGLTLTGQLGDVMKESAQAAVSYARSRAEVLGIDPDFHAKNDIHIHVPAGGIPKDGPSAGVTIATSLISALTCTPVNKAVAMTGEITLRGRVLPIGGLKEKTLAAHRAGIRTIILPAKNRADLEELPPKIRRSMTFVTVDSMDEVLATALVAKEKGAAAAPENKEPTPAPA
ncbi:MAG: endopeptidase La [Candidatus Methylomirabilia bacterium]